jgi:hypothetical protein
MTLAAPCGGLPSSRWGQGAVSTLVCLQVAAHHGTGSSGFHALFHTLLHSHPQFCDVQPAMRCTRINLAGVYLSSWDEEQQEQ